MPSPAIPHLKSAPDISSPHSPDMQASTKPFLKSGADGSPLTSWPKKFGGFVSAKTKNSSLTEENLQEFNKRNAEARNITSSPYYKGLTDSSLVINREKLSGTSPGRESYVTSAASRSSFVVRVQEWGSSCFTSKSNEKRSPYSSVSFWTKSTAHEINKLTTSSSSSSRSVTETLPLTKVNTKATRLIESESEKGKVTGQSMKSRDDITAPTVEKPLRERDSESPYILPPPLAQVSISSPPPTPLYPSPPPLAQVSISSPPPTPLYPSPPPAVQAPPSQTPAAGVAAYENDKRSITKVEDVYVWSDRYRPYWLQDFICNKTKALWLQQIVRSWKDTAEECGHFIFEGNPGVGKRTMIWALLREAFGQEKVQVRKECKRFYLKGEAVGSILVNLMVSSQHIEVNLSELKGYEKHVIVQLIKENNQIISDTSHCKQEDCKAIILYEADKLSTDALPYIKWMLERFKGCNKVFFCCRDAKKLQPIMPICKYVQLNEPSVGEILEVLKFIAEKEGIQLPHELAYKIANNSKNNLRQAIRSFEATWHLNASLTEYHDIKTGWEDKIANIARNVLEEQSPKQLYHIRGELQNLIEHNVAPEFIFQTLKEELKKILPEQLKPEFDQLHKEYQQNHAVKNYLPSAHQQEELGKRQNDQRKNVQQFMRIEEFIARFMSWYKGLVIKNKEGRPDGSKDASQ